MHVITHKKFIDFWSNYPETKEALERFYKIIEKTKFNDFNQLRQTFCSADQVGKCTVFNVGGNKVRVIAAIHYNSHKIYIKHVLTHSECDQNKWKIGCL